MPSARSDEAIPGACYALAPAKQNTEQLITINRLPQTHLPHLNDSSTGQHNPAERLLIIIQTSIRNDAHHFHGGAMCILFSHFQVTTIKITIKRRRISLVKDNKSIRQIPVSDLS
jgi:hypothetical protein